MTNQSFAAPVDTSQRRTIGTKQDLEFGFGNDRERKPFMESIHTKTVRNISHSPNLPSRGLPTNTQGNFSKPTNDLFKANEIYQKGHYRNQIIANMTKRNNEDAQGKFL